MTAEYSTSILSIVKTSSEMAVRQSGAAARIGAVIECAIAASSPLFDSLFKEDTPHQDRLLFVLALAGSCTHFCQSNEEYNSWNISITPHAITKAFNTYRLITGRDITPHLPVGMVNFAASQKLN